MNNRDDRIFEPGDIAIWPAIMHLIVVCDRTSDSYALQRQCLTTVCFRFTSETTGIGEGWLSAEAAKSIVK